MAIHVPRIKSIRDQVYEGLKGMIVSGQLPQGAKLQENDLAELFQVSRTPVREALKLLREDGLVESPGGKGLFVRVLTPKNVTDIFQVRQLLEGFALAQAAQNLDEGRRRRLRELEEQFATFRGRSDEMEAYIQLDTQLHTYLIECSDNLFLRELTGRIYDILQPVRVLSLSDRQRYEESIEEHLQIIQGLLAGDPQRAAQGLERHLLEAREMVLQVLRNQLPPDPQKPET